MNLFYSPLLLALAFLTSTTLHAQANKAEPKSSATEVKKTSSKSRASYPFYGQLVSITSKTLTVRSGADKPERKFTLTKDTVILKNNRPSSIEDAKEGQWIGGSVSKSDQGNDRVLKLNLSAKAKNAKSSAKRSSAKKDAAS